MGTAFGMCGLFNATTLKCNDLNECASNFPSTPEGRSPGHLGLGPGRGMLAIQPQDGAGVIERELVRAVPFAVVFALMTVTPKCQEDVLIFAYEVFNFIFV